MSPSALAIDAGLEREKTVDGAKLQAAIRDEDETAGRIDHEPRRKHVAAPEMQEDRNQRELLGQPQHHLDEVRRPARNSRRPAGRCHPRLQRPACRARRFAVDQAASFAGISSALLARDGMSIADRGSRKQFCCLHRSEDRPLISVRGNGQFGADLYRFFRRVAGYRR